MNVADPPPSSDDWTCEGQADILDLLPRPKLLDLFACEGGAGTGYHRAGYDVYALDIEPQPRNPFPFHQGDAIEALDILTSGGAVPFTHPGGRTEPIRLRDLAAVHASPTCQTFAAVTEWRGSRDTHPDLLTPTLAALETIAIPWVVENVPEAPLRRDYILCGTQFGLSVRRHRVFQRGNWDAYDLLPPCHCYRNRRLLAFEHKDERAYADALGCDWMTARGGRQAIPPAYTEFIGSAMLAATLGAAA